MVENSYGNYTTECAGAQGVPFKIDPEFQNKIPPIGEDEFKQLRENILTAGEVYEPLVVWDGTLVDGHNRWKVIQENPTIKWRTREMQFADKWAAFEWMYKNQLGRRNLTDEQRSYTIGKMYEARKNTSAFKGNQYTARSGDTQNGRHQTQTEVKQGTAGQIANELRIGNNTVIRAEKFAKGVDALRKVNPEAADKVLSGKAEITKTEVQRIAKATPDEVIRVADLILNPSVRKQREVGTKVSRVRVDSEEDRQKMKEIESIVNDMYDPTTTPEFDIDMLIEDIEINAEIYVQLLTSTLEDRSNLITDENKPRIAAAIDKVVENIKKVRELL